MGEYMTFQERRQRITDTESELWFVEVRMSSTGETLRLVNDTQDWTSNGQVYLGSSFSIQPPSDVSGQSPKARLVIGNIGLGLTQDLEARLPGEEVECRSMLADRADPHTYVRSYRFPMVRVSVTTGEVSAENGTDILMRGQAVRKRYTPYETPGIF